MLKTDGVLVGRARDHFLCHHAPKLERVFVKQNQRVCTVVDVELFRGIFRGSSARI